MFAKLEKQPWPLTVEHRGGLKMAQLWVGNGQTLHLLISYKTQEIVSANILCLWAYFAATLLTGGGGWFSSQNWFKVDI